MFPVNLEIIKITNKLESVTVSTEMYNMQQYFYYPLAYIVRLIK